MGHHATYARRGGVQGQASGTPVWTAVGPETGTTDLPNAVDRWFLTLVIPEATCTASRSVVKSLRKTNSPGLVRWEIWSDDGAGPLELISQGPPQDAGIWVTPARLHWSSFTPITMLAGSRYWHGLHLLAPPAGAILTIRSQGSALPPAFRNVKSSDGLTWERLNDNFSHFSSLYGSTA